jgi:hypothetical protein
VKTGGRKVRKLILEIREAQMRRRECPCMEKTKTGRQKGEGSGNVGAEASDCEDERSGWDERKGEGRKSIGRVLMTVREEGRGAEGHLWVVSVT